MRWTERQRAMLREMGVQLWSREPALVEESVAVEIERPVAALAPAIAAPAPSAATTTVPASDWLVVGDPLDPVDPRQAALLDNLLRAIGASRTASSRAGRAVFVDDPKRVASAVTAAAPRCVIALGRAAAAALLGRDEAIGAWRGRSHRHGDVPVVVTFSLAFLLRHPAEKSKAWLDLCLAVRASEAPGPSTINA